MKMNFKKGQYENTVSRSVLWTPPRADMEPKPWPTLGGPVARPSGPGSAAHVSENCLPLTKS